MKKILPADVVLLSGDNFFDIGIKWATQSKNEDKTVIIHCGVAINEEEYIDSNLTTQITKFCSVTGRYYEVWRMKSLADEQRCRIVDKAMDYYGRRYGVLKIATAFLDTLLTKALSREVFLFRRLNFNSTWPICSWIPAFCYFAVLRGYRFNSNDPRACTPDDIHDHVKASGDWKLIRVNDPDEVRVNDGTRERR